MSKNIYDPIRALNEDNARRFWWPKIAPVLFMFSCLFGVILVYAKGPQIDAWATKHPFLVVSIGVPMCLFGLWRLFKMIAW